MKKTILFTAIFALCFQAQSQNIRFGFTGGVSFANIHSKADGTTNNGNSKTGILAGILIDAPFNSHFSFQPGLQFVQKGMKNDLTIGGATEKVKLNTNYVEMPLNLLYNANSNPGNFFIGAGPSIALGISGEWKYDSPGNSLTQSVKFGTGDQNDIKSLELGANFTSGFCLPDGLFIAANFSMSLNNLMPGGSAYGTLKNRYFGVRIGYLLKNNKRK